MTWPTLPSDWSAGQVLTSAALNSILDALQYLDGAWDTYTPTWEAATTSPTVGNGTITGRYLLIGKRLVGQIALECGSSTDGGAGAWTFSLPAGVTVTGALQDQVGVAALRNDSLNNNYPAFCTLASTTTLQIGHTGDDWVGEGDVFLTLQSGDFIRLAFDLEVD